MLLGGCGDKSQPQQDTGNAVAVAVSTLQARQRPVPLVFDAVSRTEGSREVEVRARVSGILDKQTYSEGTMVKRGEVLFHIDPAPFEIALAHARAALAEQQAASMQARRNADRLATLVAQKAVSRSVADDALSALDSAQAAVLAAQANVREAELNLSYTKVTASIGGIAGRALHSEGSLVTAGTDSSLLTTVTQSDPLWVRFAVSDDEFAALRAATREAVQNGGTATPQARASGSAALTIELLQKNGEPYPHRGRVNFAGSEVDTRLGTIQLRAEFPNPDLGILPGEYLRVRLSGGAQAAMVVPQTAVLQGPQGPYVWIVNDKDQAEQRRVQTGAWIGADWQIRSGLAEGDAVIVDNLLKLKSGQAVQAQPARVADDRSSLAERPDGVAVPTIVGQSAGTATAMPAPRDAG
jgi:membrane fusion protein (multidrug efflux system)